MKRIAVIVLLSVLLASALAFWWAQRPTPTAQIANEWEAEHYVAEYLLDAVTTYHGQLVLAEVVDVWIHGPCSQNSDGSWMVTICLNDLEVEGNALLDPIFQNPRSYDSDVKYCMEWMVSADGTVVTPANGNAMRFAAELAAE